MKLTNTLYSVVLAFIAILLLGTAKAQQPAFLTNGLVAYYPFNGNANDGSGNNHDGGGRF